MTTKYAELLIERCDCLDGLTPKEVIAEIDKYGFTEEITGNLWEDVPFINKELPFARDCYEDEK